MNKVKLNDTLVNTAIHNTINSLKREYSDITGEGIWDRHSSNSIECDISLPNPYEVCTWEWWQYSKLFDKPKFEIEKILKSKMNINLIECCPECVVISLPVAYTHKNGALKITNQVKSIINQYCKDQIEGVAE